MPWLGIAAIVALAALLSQRPSEAARADPPGEHARQQHLQVLARGAADTLARLDSQLQEARVEARAGATAIQQGSDPPGPQLEAAAARLESAAALAEEAREASGELDGTLRAVRPAWPAFPPEPLPGAPQLAGIADQLRAAVPAGAAFVEWREAAQRTLVELEAALAALESGAPDDALLALDRAAAARRQVGEWEPAPVTLPLWMETTERLISAARRIAEATLAGDAGAAEAAAREYAAAAEEARRADVSLALSLAETGSGITAVPLQRLADALAATTAARGAVAPLVQTAP